MVQPDSRVVTIVFVQGLRPEDEIDDKITAKVDLDDIDERISRITISSRVSEDARSPSPLPVDSKPATPIIPERPKTPPMPRLYPLSDEVRVHNHPFEFPQYAASGDTYYETLRQKAISASKK